MITGKGLAAACLIFAVNVRYRKQHCLFDCDKYSGQRESLKDGVLRVVTTKNLQCGDIDIKVITGNVKNISKSGEAVMVNAVLNYIQETQRFVN